MPTGCWKNGILKLRWQDVVLDAMKLRLADTTKGARTVPLSTEAARVLAGIPRSEDYPWAIRGRKKGQRQPRMDRQLRIARERAGLYMMWRRSRR